MSPTTVSHALSGARSVNAQTRERILVVARELGYAPDRVASGLRRQRTGIVGFIGDHVATTPFAGRIIAGARAAGLERDVLLLVVETEGDEAEESALVDLMRAQRVDGLLLARSYNQRIARPRLAADVPIVLIDAAPDRRQGRTLHVRRAAPVSGHGLDVALGYLLLPLIMVVVGRVIHREHLARLRAAAVAAAAIGVISAIVLAGGISAATVVVALGYPIYFELRARFHLNTPGALALELATLVPVAIVLAFLQPWPATGTAELAIGLLAIGLVSTAALLLYLRASELLPLGLFGLLTYVEPVLLAIVSITILGESLTPTDLLAIAHQRRMPLRRAAATAAVREETPSWGLHRSARAIGSSEGATRDRSTSPQPKRTH